MRSPRLMLAALAGMAAFLAAPAAIAENQSVVSGSDDEFRAKLVAVKPGESVTWTNPTGNGEHNVVWNDGKVSPMPAESVDGSLWPAGGVSRTFDRAGRYRYYCALHGDKGFDFGMYGYVYVNPAGQLPPVVSKLAATVSAGKVTVKFKSNEAGKAKVTILRKSGKRFVRKTTASFSAKAGATTTKRISTKLDKGSYRFDVVVTDADKVASDVKSKTFKVS